MRAITWRAALFAAFAWLIVGDSVRRLVPGQPPAVTLVGDALLGLAYVLYFLERRRAGLVLPPVGMAVRVSLFAYLALVAVGMVVSLATDPLLALLGVRTYLLFLPAALLAYHGFGVSETLRRGARWVVLLSLPLLALALLQMALRGVVAHPLLLPFESADELHSFYGTEGIPYISSVFGTHARYSRFCLLAFLLGVALLVSERERRTDLLLMVGVAAAAIGAFVSGQRMAMGLLVVSTPVLVLLSLRRGEAASRLPLRKLLGAGALVVVGFLALAWVSPSNAAFFLRAPEQLVERLAWAFEDIAAGAAAGGWFGNGIGSASSGAQYLGAPASGVESGVAKLLYEFGVLGPLVVLALYATVLLRSNAARRHADEGRPLIAAMAVFTGSALLWFALIHHQVLGDALTLATVWFGFGSVLRASAPPEGPAERPRPHPLAEGQR